MKTHHKQVIHKDRSKSDDGLADGLPGPLTDAQRAREEVHTACARLRSGAPTRDVDLARAKRGLEDLAAQRLAAQTAQRPAESQIAANLLADGGQEFRGALTQVMLDQERQQEQALVRGSPENEQAKLEQAVRHCHELVVNLDALLSVQQDQLDAVESTTAGAGEYVLQAEDDIVAAFKLKKQYNRRVIILSSIAAVVVLILIFAILKGVGVIGRNGGGGKVTVQVQHVPRTNQVGTLTT